MRGGIEGVPGPLLVVAIGAGIGFLGGLLGKGGSAIATPILAAVGVPPLIAVAAPLPATLPGTLVAAEQYRRVDLVERSLVRWALLAGVPTTIAGALLTRIVDPGALVVATDVMIVGLGLRLARRGAAGSAHPEDGLPVDGAHRRRRTIAVAAATGFVGGLLASGGGFLLAPLFATVVRLPLKRALGTSLAVASVLAVPATVVHLALGHIDWAVVMPFAAGSLPLAAVGARLAIRLDPARLERAYGALLVVLGIGLLAHAALA